MFSQTKQAPRLVPALRVPRAADVLADHLRAKILAGELATGAMLPTERDLAEQSGVGRSSVREALRTLEIQGLIATRPGRNGGSLVVQPTPESLAQSVDVFIRGRRVGLEAVVEARQAIEPVCAQLAAVRRSDAELAELVAINERMAAAVGDNPAFLRANVEWHTAVAAASHNALFAGFLLAISEAVHAWTDVRRLDAPAVRTAALDAHERILAAVRARDGGAARRRMERHVRAYGEQLHGLPSLDGGRREENAGAAGENEGPAGSGGDPVHRGA